MPVRGAYQKLPLIAPLRWLTLPLSEWPVAALLAGVKKKTVRWSQRVGRG